MTGGVSAARPTPAGATGCLILPVTAYVKDADIVLLGRAEAARENVVGATSMLYPLPVPATINGWLVTVTVKALWKGTTPPTIELRQSLGFGDPPFREHIGEDFLLFVRRLPPERALWPNSTPAVMSGFTAAPCSWRLADKIDLNDLGPSRPPVQ
jgi:hypothetical protein